MITNLSFEYSPLWFVPILMGALALVWVLYFSDKSFSKAKKWALAILRFLVLFIIGFLLISPYLRVSTRVNDKPILVWMEDHSSSMVLNKDSTEVKKLLNEFSESTVKQLSDKYDVREIDFNTQLEENSQGFNGNETNMSLAFQEVKQRFYNENVTATVVVSDGIFNRGVSPVYEAQNSPFPIHTIGFGDTSIRKDIFIESLVHNELTYLNNGFPLEINVRARECIGEKAHIVVTNNKETLYSDTFEILSEEHFQEIELYLTPDTVGIQRYIVAVTPLEGEAQIRNNQQSFNIEVVDNRKKVLILGSSPHPDMAAISAALASFDKYEVNTVLEQDYDFQEEAPDLYLLHQPGIEALNLVKSSSKPYWIIYGPSVNAASFTSLSGIRIGNRSFEPVQSYINTSFNLFTLNEDLSDFVTKLPPLQSPFGKVRLPKSFTPLFLKKIRRVESGEYLWFFGENQERRASYTMGLGLWQWRMYNYRQNGDFQFFDELIAQNIQYLTAKSEDQRFVVESESVFDKSSPVIFNARLYNLSLELTNAPDVELSIRSEKGEEYNFTFGKTSYAYRINAGSLPPANYSWVARTKLSDEVFERSGVFSVQSSDLEQSDLVARHRILRQVAAESNGKFYHSTQMERITEDLLNNSSAKSIQRLETNISSLLNKKWIFFTLLLLLAAEWGLRKFFGKY